MGAWVLINALWYNAVHIYAFGVVFLALGLGLDPIMAGTGALWVAHAGFDRLLGYGLKSPEGFSFTHLGRIGKSRPAKTPGSSDAP